MDFRVLGPVEVLDEGQAVPLGGRKQRTVLAILVSAPGAPVSVDRLAEALWGESPPERARGSIQTYISNLRGLVGDCIDFRGDGYVLEVDPESVDRLRFEALVDRGKELVDTDPVQARAVLRNALALWRGPPFADLDGHAALRPIITALEETRLVALETRIEANLATGRHAEVVGELESLCEEFPLRERLRELHMLALYRAGRQADALRAFQKTRAHLAEMGIEPSSELQELEQRILEQSSSLELRRPVDRPSTVTSVPRPRSRLVGREPDVRRIEELVDKHRLVTLTGVGGSGKTRLAVEIGIRFEGRMADGVFFVDLSSVDVDERVAGEIGRQMGMRAGLLGELVADPLQELTTHLVDQRILLIIDNCEHLLDGCTTVIDALLSKCRHLRVLATSREPLGVEGEQLWLVAPLSLPDETDGGGAAVELLVDRIVSHRPDFDVEGSQVEMEMIARRLDGIPLALELAAHRVAHLGAAEVLTRLDDRFQLLIGGRGRPQRQQTLGATLDWSHDLLEEREQRLLRRLAGFPGSFDLEAAEGICHDPDIGQVAEVLGSLLDKSLVVVDSVDGRHRYRLLETVRMYAQEKLVASGEAAEIRENHRDWYVEWVERHSLDETMNHFRVVDALEVEYENIRRAVEWSINHREWGIALHQVMHTLGLSYYRGHHEDVRKWAERLLVGTEDDPEANAVARIAHDFTFVLDRDAGPTSSLRSAQEAVIKAMEVLPEDHPARFVACHDLWAGASVQFDPDGCLHWAMEGQRVSRLAGMRWAEVFARGTEGCSYLYLYDFEAATEVFAQAFSDPAVREWDTGVTPYQLAISAFLSDDMTTARTVVNAVDVDRKTPDPYLLPLAIAIATVTLGAIPRARSWMQEAVSELRSLRWTRPLASREVLVGLSLITLLEQDLTTAMRHLSATRSGTGRPITYTPGGAVLWRRCADELKQELDPALREQLIEEGSELAVEDAIDEQMARIATAD